jgi:adenylate cyclase
MPLLPVIEFYRGSFGIEACEEAHEARLKIARGALRADATLEAELPLLFEFLGVPDADRPAPALDPEARERRLLELFRRIAMARGPGETLVLVLEDLHGTDPATERFLAAIAAATERNGDASPRHLPSRYGAGWMRRSYYQQIAAPARSDGVSRADRGVARRGSVARRARHADCREDRRQSLLSGEESCTLSSNALCSMERAAAIGSSARSTSSKIPATVQAVLAARIDRLPSAKNACCRPRP